MKPISNKVRETIVKHHKNGKSVREIAGLVSTSTNTVYRVLALFEKTGSIKPKPCPGNNRKITCEQKAQILERVKKGRDTTLRGLIDELELNITESGLSKWMARHHITYKKNFTSKRSSWVKHKI